MNVTVNVRTRHFCDRRPKGYRLSQLHARSHVQEPLVPCKVKHSGNNITVSWPQVLAVLLRAFLEEVEKVVKRQEGMNMGQKLAQVAFPRHSYSKCARVDKKIRCDFTIQISKKSLFVSLVATVRLINSQNVETWRDKIYVLILEFACGN